MSEGAGENAGTGRLDRFSFVAVYLALPFYRSIDATSAYEYLERRFNRPVRLIGSAFFTVFHLFRMGVVMSLTGLALAVATPLTPTQSVLLIGFLSILYATMGGIEAVIWTDTIQTVVLLGGALLAFGFLIAGADGGFGGFVETASAADKFRLAHFHSDITSTQIALWIIVIGLFMGVLGGLFVLGVTTCRANSTGALVGGLAGAAIMVCLWQFSEVIFYAYTTIGIVSCVTIGYLASLVFPGRRAVNGLTIHTLGDRRPSTGSHADR